MQGERLAVTGRWGWRLAAGMAITAALGYMAVRKLDWRAASHALAQADPRFVGLAVAAMLGNIALKVLRWHGLYYPARGSPSCRHLLAALMVGQLGNVLLPARLGDAVRLGVISTKGRSGLAQAALTLAVEKAADSAMLLAMLAAMLPFATAANWLNWRRLAPAATLAILLAIGVLLATQGSLYLRLQRAAARIRPGPFAVPIQRGLAELGRLQALRDGKYQARLWGLSAAIWLLSGLVNWFGFAAMHLALPLSAGFLLAVTEIAGNNVAYAPAGIGVYHAICVLTLSLYGVNLGPALGVAILLHTVVYAPIILLGLASMWAEGLPIHPANGSETDAESCCVPGRTTQ